MRITSLFVAAAVGAGLLAGAGTASANCYSVEPVDDCFNPCSATVSAYVTANQATGGKLPGIPDDCPQ